MEFIASRNGKWNLSRLAEDDSYKVSKMKYTKHLNVDEALIYSIYFECS